MIRKLCIVGVGLIGGSLARALREAGGCQEIVGSSRDAGHLQRAVDLGVIDRYELNLARAVDGADMVVACVPMGAMEAVFRAISSHLSSDAVLTDAGSSKVSVVKAAKAAFGTCPPNFVPAHPVAGTENSGVGASFASLYRGRRVIVTPTETSSREATRRVKEMWAATGAELSEMAPEQHDLVLAATSHLPHLLAYNLVDVLGRMEQSQEIFKYAAGGFRDFSRIASSDPTMWHDICIANGPAILEALRSYQADLAAIEKAIENADSEYLYEVFTRSKSLRDRYTENDVS